LTSVQEVENHKDEESAWVIVEGKVYDVTDFLYVLLAPILDLAPKVRYEMLGSTLGLTFLSCM
jgi:hypothetical protein